MRQVYINERLKNIFKALKSEFEEEVGFKISLKEYFRHLLDLVEDELKNIDKGEELESLRGKLKDKKGKKIPSALRIEDSEKERFNELKEKYESNVSESFCEIEKIEFVGILLMLGLNELDIYYKELRERVEEV